MRPRSPALRRASLPTCAPKHRHNRGAAGHQASTSQGRGTYFGARKRSPASRESDYRRVFREFDRDESGFIDRSEFHKACNDLGINLSSSELSRMIEKFDRDGDGQVSVSEFVKFAKGGGFGAQLAAAAAAGDAAAPSFKLGAPDAPASNGRIDGGEFQRFFLQLRLEEIERAKQHDAAALRARDKYIFKLTREHVRTKPKQTGR